MILRRLASALKRQDWFQVIVEILIVVVGIFLGLQVSEWNEGRKENLLAQQTLEKLEVEYIVILAESKLATDFHINVVNSLQQLLICVENNCPKQELDQLVPQTISTGDSFNLVPPQSNTYMELVNAGNINLIKDPELRSALYRADVNMSNVRQSYASLNDYILVFIRNFKRYALVNVSALSPFDLETFSQGPSYKHQLLPVIGAYDWGAMRDDPEFRLALEQILRLQVYYVSNHAYILQDVIAVSKLLKDMS